MIAWIKSFLSGRSQNVVLDGEQSGACPVLSGVPQDSGLGPCLFLMYINDMPDSIKSNIRLFANDTIMYLTITNHSDCQALQSDLTTLESWESELLMHSILRSVKSLGSRKRKKTVLFDYKLHGITLQLTKNAKYLGIQISDDIAWSKHINQMTTKSNNTLKFTKRNIQTNVHKIKGTAYKTYVRP